MDDSRKPERGTEAPKTTAEDNPWYLLATLYGVPESSDYDLQKQNRVAWNRYFAAGLAWETRVRLFKETRYPAEALTSFSPEQLREVAEAFAQRCKCSSKSFALPATDSLPNFKSVEFDRPVLFTDYLFNSCCFQDAIFRDLAIFNQVRFRIDANFRGATFCDHASFAEATFDNHATFAGVTFSGRANLDSAIFSYGFSPKHLSGCDF